MNMTVGRIDAGIFLLSTKLMFLLKLLLVTEWPILCASPLSAKEGYSCWRTLLVAIL